MSYKRNIALLFNIRICRSLVFAYVIERLFALERGLTVEKLVYIEVLFGVLTVLLEVPSGVLADRFGKRTLLRFAAVCEFFEFFVVIFARGFWLFAVSAVFAAVGGACRSGAVNALLYDSLSAEARREDFEKTVGRLRAADVAASLLAALAGAALASACGYTLNYWLSALACAVGFILTLFLREAPASGGEGEDAPKSSLTEIGKTAFRFFRARADVLRVLLFAALVAACVLYADEYWQVYLDAAGFPVALFGVVSGIFSLAALPGSLLAARALRRLSHGAVMLLGCAGVAGGLFIAAAANGPWGIAGLAAAFVFAALMEPAASGYLHRRADPSARATIESFAGLLERGVGIAVGLAFGLLATRFSVALGFALLGAVAAAGGILFYCTRCREEL